MCRVGCPAAGRHTPLDWGRAKGSVHPLQPSAPEGPSAARAPRGSGYPGAEPHPVLQHCSGTAGSRFLQFNQGIRIFRQCRLHRNAIPAAPTARHRCHWCGAFPFPEGQDIPCPQGHASIAVSYQALHGSRIPATWIHMDPQFPLPLTPLLGATGDTCTCKCSQPGMEQWKRGEDDPQEGMG